jgi:hypothetical protein
MTRNLLKVSQRFIPDSKVLAVSIVDHRVLNHEARASISVPPIGILRYIDASAMPSNVDIVEYNIGGVGNEVVILG